MNAFYNLLKFNISYYLKPRFKDKKQRNKFIGAIVVIALCFLAPIALMIFTMYNAAGLAIQQNVISEFLSTILLFVQIAVILMGTSSYLSIMYFSNDNELLMSMPIKNSSIYISKLIVCLLSMMLISSLLIVPTLIATGVAVSNAGLKLGVNFYLGGLLGIFCVPLIPLLLISIISFPIMKIISYLKKKPALMAILTAILSVGLLLVIYIPMFKFQASFDMEDPNFLNQAIQVISIIGKFAYPTYVLSNIIFGTEILKNVAIFLAITLASLALGVLLSVLLYRNTISKLKEGGVVKNATKEIKEVKSLSVKKALLGRECKFIARESQLLLQSIMMLIMGPVMIIILMVAMPTMPEEEISGLRMATINTGLVYFYFTIMQGMNYLSIVAISREGNKLSLLKSLPVEAKQIVKIKLYLADIVSLLACVIDVIIYVILVKNVPWYFGLLLFVNLSVFSLSINAFGMMRDVKNPNLKWINVKDITKNNMGVFIPMLVSMGPGLVALSLSFVVAGINIADNYVLLIFWSILLLINIVYYFIFRFKKLDKMIELYDKIEP